MSTASAPFNSNSNSRSNASRCSSSSSSSSILSSIDDIHPLLRERISQTTYPCISSPNVPASYSFSSSAATAAARLNAVLYLPTVLLRYEHNPAFAVACRVANAQNIPVLVLAVVPDDSSISKARRNMHAQGNSSNGGQGNGKGGGDNGGQGNGGNGNGGKPIVMTSRRLAFYLEALSSAVPPWSNHGAAVAIRIHGSGHSSGGCRTPDHLTLARRCRFVVCDEPFVDPYLGLVERVENAARSAGVECVRVDGSTTVPPAALLWKVPKRNNYDGSDGGGSNGDSKIKYEGVPSKAWMWQKKTDGKRMDHVKAAMGGCFDAPELRVKISRDCFFEDPPLSDDTDSEKSHNAGDGNNHDPSTDESFLAALPSTWRNTNAPAPGVRPWTANDIAALDDIKHWATNWPGADSTVPPCTQTVGTSQAGMKRWNDWIARNGLVEYGRRRTDPRKPHASSRMSCYLNLGIVSIFRLVHEVMVAEKKKVAGASKFIEEIVKWREGSYVHAFARTDYAGVGSVPRWAVQYLEDGGGGSNAVASLYSYDIESLESGKTGDEKWDAMQRYLVNTGELHNNVRMTWGKTIMGWAPRLSFREEGGSVTSTVLQTLCYLNDRYALDGLSPPSYGGLLWCLGWGDKPGAGGAIAPKPASRYKYGPDDFRKAEATLLGQSGSTGSGNVQRNMSQGSLLDMMNPQSKAKRQRTDKNDASKPSPKSSASTETTAAASSRSSPVSAKGPLHKFFSPPSAKR